jgi:glycosyltransferase involved in cell wall biosynthesis
MEYRPYYLAKQWVLQGQEVTILASSFSHLRIKAPTIENDITTEWIDGIRYHWLKGPTYESNGIHRVINIFTFIGKLFYYRQSLIREIQPDVVIASSTYPLDVFPAYIFAKAADARLIFEIHDLWPLTLIELANMPRWHPFIILMQIAEGFAYRHADRVVSVLPKTKEYMCSRGMAPEKFFYIPNGIDIAEWQTLSGSLPAEHLQVLDRLKQDGRFILGYAGGHGPSNALDTLIEAACKMQEQPITFVLVGHGSEKERLQGIVHQQQISNVLFLPSVPKLSLPTLLARMDVLYVGWKKSPLYRFGISPNKLLDYMMASKPIIHGVAAANDLVTESDCGISIPPEDSNTLVQAIEHLMQTRPDLLKEMGLRGKTYVIDRYNYKVLAQKFLNAIR